LAAFFCDPEGHSDLKITEAYIATFDEDVVDKTLVEVFK